MAELTIRPEDVSSALRSLVEEFDADVEQEQVGRVTESGDGIAHIAGLPGTLANELLDFGGGLFGLAMNLDEDTIGAVIMGEWSSVEEGDTVRRTGRVLSVPVGDGLLGRVIDPLGRPVDGKGPLDDSRMQGRRNLEVQAPGVVERQPVNEPLQTGIKAIDVMIPIGRGQRELIIGDRQTGKTALAVDTIINQRRFWGTERAVKCIYVAIAQKGSTVAEVVQRLEEHGALEYTVVINAAASTPAAYQYVAPYSGAAIGNHWMWHGEHALAVYDDLSKHADSYRQLSLLLRRPPGREAYPGDIFYTHSRLLERAAKLNDANGAGSLTALPIVETKAGDVSAYIPTNVISITDGQIYLEQELFNEGVRPAVNAGSSVSRVGGNAQVPVMKKIAGRVRLDLANYRELESFAQFGSELDKSAQRQIARGERVVEVLKQPQYQPVPVGEQIVTIWAVTNGRMDDIPVDDIERFERELRDYMRSRHGDLLDRLQTAKLDEVEDKLRSAVDGFVDQFEPSEEEDEDEENAGWDMMSASEDEEQEDTEGAEA
ncbi:MAG: F0F1 ATP synthase subunit alpha [Actinobacteria bacterium]|nr:F0F1 ATP synthase subunit alpha [Actinomycetota bacterium]